MRLTGKTALVTGGSRGIGRAVCQELASLGANIVINYIDEEATAQETAALCQAHGVETLLCYGDISDAAQCQQVFEQAANAFGQVDILVNNAGVTRDNLLVRMSEADFDQVLAINLKGAFLCAKLAARPMMKARWGRIINISSVVGLHGNAGQANYAASKAGLIGLTKSLAKELASRNITVNAIAPGFIETNMTAVLPEQVKAQLLEQIPAGSLGTPADVARAVAFFALPESAYLTGQVLAVDGGMSM